MIGAAAIGLGSMIYGAIKGSQANRDNQNLLNSIKADNESFYNNNVNQDFLRTNAAKGMYTRLDKNLRDANKTVESKAAATGGTAEAVIAAKDKNQEAYNDTVSRIAEKATDYQQGQEAMYRGQKAQTDNKQMAVNDNKAQSAANVASNAAGFMSGAADLSDFSYLANKTPVLGKTDSTLKTTPYRGVTLGSK